MVERARPVRSARRDGLWERWHRCMASKRRRIQRSFAAGVSSLESNSANGTSMTLGFEGSRRRDTLTPPLFLTGLTKAPAEPGPADLEPTLIGARRDPGHAQAIRVA